MSINAEGLSAVKTGLSVATRQVEQTISSAASTGLEKDTLDISKNSTPQTPVQGIWAKVKNFFGQVWDWLKGLFSTKKNNNCPPTEDPKPKTTHASVQDAVKKPTQSTSDVAQDKTVNESAQTSELAQTKRSAKKSSSQSNSKKEKVTGIKSQHSGVRDYSHLVCIGEDSKPSPEFVAKAQQAVTTLMNSLPRKLRRLAIKQGFGVKIYHSPDDYMKRFDTEGIQAFLPDSVIRDVKKRVEDKRQMLKEHYEKAMPDEKINDVFMDEAIKDVADEALQTVLLERMGCKAYYSQNYKNIILHEKLNVLELIP